MRIGSFLQTKERKRGVKMAEDVEDTPVMIKRHMISSYLWKIIPRLKAALV